MGPETYRRSLSVDSTSGQFLLIFFEHRINRYPYRVELAESTSGFHRAERTAWFGLDTHLSPQSLSKLGISFGYKKGDPFGGNDTYQVHTNLWLGLPYWLVSLCSLPLPLWWLARRRRAKRQHPGFPLPERVNDPLPLTVGKEQRPDESP
jgi:hypothetical protein